MIRSTPELDALERRWAARTLVGMSYREALDWFEGLWREARAIAPDFPGDWEADMEADLAIGFVLNAPPPVG